MINMHFTDGFEFIKNKPDKYYDLALIDPPYGIGEGNEKKMKSRHPTGKKYKGGTWDEEPPSPEYFEQLFRVSKNQIIFGANHFISRIPYNSSCWIVWDKNNANSDFADCELAWTSFKTAVRMFRWTWDGFRKQVYEDRIHPTQKPVGLYKLILKKFAKNGDKIVDTYGGSGSICIACHDLGLDLDWCENDPDYFKDAEERFKNHISNDSRKLFKETL